ncbi:MAG: Rrf2 family transcriptional regulator [Nitrospirae bacterium]|nr:Rrf2 family transcriptional regulator [Nitrospirota bacterium]
MLKFTKKTDYGLMAIGCLAEQEGKRPATTKAIADQCHIPVELLAKILQRLAKHGLIQSHNGSHGGYSLARELSRITVGEVIEAIEGPLAIAACYREHGEGACDQLSHCTIRRPLGQVQADIAALLSRMTLDDIYAPTAKEEGVRA